MVQEAPRVSRRLQEALGGSRKAPGGSRKAPGGSRRLQEAQNPCFPKEMLGFSYLAYVNISNMCGARGSRPSV